MLKKIIVMSLFLSFSAHADVKVRIGWQIPWALQGQLIQVLKNTEILKNNGIQAEFIGRTYGPELNEIALAGAIDVVLTADQPAATLFAKNKGWVGVSRLMYNRTATYVPLKSPIKNIKDLKGKTIGVPMGAAAQRVTAEALTKAGLSVDQDIKFVNLAMPEHAPLIKRASVDAKTWDQFDALSGFDPIPAVLEVSKMVRILDKGKVCSLVLMNTDFLQKNPGVAKSLQKALAEAYIYYQKNTAQVDQWFIAESKLADVTPKALAVAASLEPNMKVNRIDQIKLNFSEEDFELLQKGADFVAKGVGVKINMKDFVSNDYVK